MSVERNRLVFSDDLPEGAEPFEFYDFAREEGQDRRLVIRVSRLGRRALVHAQLLTGLPASEGDGNVQCRPLSATEWQALAAVLESGFWGLSADDAAGAGDDGEVWQMSGWRGRDHLARARRAPAAGAFAPLAAQLLQLAAMPARVTATPELAKAANGVFLPTSPEVMEYRREKKDPTLERLILQGRPLTRRSYIDAHWWPEPKPWTAEHERKLPPFLLDPAVILAWAPALAGQMEAAKPAAGAPTAVNISGGSE